MTENQTYTTLYTLIQDEYEKYASLPMAVYATARDGRIIVYNNAARDFFHFDDNHNENKWIQHFYKDKSERTRVMESLALMKAGEWKKNETLEFLINNNTKCLRFFSKPYFTETHEFLGSLCLSFEITALERFSAIEDIIPFGIFEIGNGHRVTYANPISEELFERGSLKGVDAKSLFLNEEKYAAIVEKLKTQKAALKDELVRFKKGKNGAAFFGKLNLMPEFDGDTLIKSKGILMDATFGNFLNAAPIGLYLVTINTEGEHIIVSANKHFAEIKGFDNPKEIEGLSILKFHKDQESYEKFLKALEKAHNRNEILIDYLLPIVTKNGERKMVIVNAKALANENGKIEGRIGAVYDITNNLTQQLTDKVSRDYASLLHSYSAMILNVKETLDAIIKGHDDPLVLKGDEINETMALKKIDGAIERLKKYVEHYLQIRAERRLPFQEGVEKLQRKLSLFAKKDKAESKERAAWVRIIAKEMRRIFKIEVNQTNIPREVIKQILTELTEILRYSRIVSLSVTIREIKDNLLEIEAFKEALTIGANKEMLEERVDIDEVMEEAINYLGDFANSRGVTIEKRYKADGSKIASGVRREIYVAFYNLVHNAIKYSWRKTSDEQSTIVVVEMEKMRHSVKIFIQNWGVPIRKEELESGIIFEFAARGASSSDRDRRGFGIGLWHARTITERHKGQLKLTSEPLLGNLRDDYTKPFVTTSILELPLKNLIN